MDILTLIFLALLQALTEFLPISSSGHLALAGFFFGFDYQGLVVDLALHFGTMIAVLAYFRDELWRIARACLAIRPGRALDTDQRLGLGIALATIPAALAGLALGDAGALVLRHPLVIAAMMAVFALLLLYADHHRGRGEEQTLSLRAMFLIGCAQALALIPGTSRSGVTMTAGLVLGLDRTAAARFSFLLSVPVMVLATAHGGYEVATGASAVRWDTFLQGAALSAVFAFAVIHFFLRFVQRLGALPFVLYRIAFAFVVAALYFGRG